jgi:hypothetical protein
MTSVFVLVFGKYNESQDFGVDCKDKNQPINSFLHKKVKYFYLKNK